MQETLEGIWINLGVDVAWRTTPAHLQPGIGLRPGEPDHPVAPYVPLLYAALFESVAAHSRLGLNVAVDVGMYDASRVADARERLDGLPVLFVGVRCPIEVIVERRAASEPGAYLVDGEPVRRWQEAVHGGWTYDLEVDTSRLTPEQCAAAIAERLS